MICRWQDLIAAFVETGDATYQTNGNCSASAAFSSCGHREQKGLNLALCAVTIPSGLTPEVALLVRCEPASALGAQPRGVRVFVLCVVPCLVFLYTAVTK